MDEFWENSLPIGYYDKILTQGLAKKRGLQANWHNSTYIKISNYIDNHAVHLDYACGPGSLIGNYLNSDQLYGVDISMNQINYAKTKYGKLGNFYTNENFKKDEYKNYFDSISAIGLLEYLTDEEIIDLLHDFYQMLKPQGELLITTPNYGGMMSLIDKLLNNFGPVNYEEENINKFNKKRLIKILKNSKYNKIDVHAFINFGIAFSFINIKLALKFSSLISKLSFNKIGFLLFAKLVK